MVTMYTTCRFVLNAVGFENGSFLETVDVSRFEVGTWTTIKFCFVFYEKKEKFLFCIFMKK